MLTFVECSAIVELASPKGDGLVRTLAAFIIAATVVLFTTASNAQPVDSYQYGDRLESWEMYRQRQVQTQIEMQRQQLEIRRQQLELQQQQLEIQRQQLEIQRQQQQLEIQRQQQQMELERQSIDRNNK